MRFVHKRKRSSKHRVAAAICCGQAQPGVVLRSPLACSKGSKTSHVLRPRSGGPNKRKVPQGTSKLQAFVLAGQGALTFHAASRMSTPSSQNQCSFPFARPVSCLAGEAAKETSLLFTQQANWLPQDRQTDGSSDPTPSRAHGKLVGCLAGTKSPSGNGVCSSLTR